MEINKCTKESFAVIGKEGSTRLWHWIYSKALG